MANGATQAVENATRLSEIGFPEFTAQLITDTFNAITTSYMEQTAQYIGVVQAVSQALQDYINNTADDISADEIGAFLLGIAGLNVRQVNEQTTPSPTESTGIGELDLTLKTL